MSSTIRLNLKSLSQAAIVVAVDERSGQSYLVFGRREFLDAIDTVHAGGVSSYAGRRRSNFPSRNGYHSAAQSAGSEAKTQAVCFFRSPAELRTILDAVKETRGAHEFDGWPASPWRLRTWPAVREELARLGVPHAELDSTASAVFRISRGDVIIACIEPSLGCDSDGWGCGQAGGDGSGDEVLHGAELLREVRHGRGQEFDSVQVERFVYADAAELDALRRLVELTKGVRLDVT